MKTKKILLILLTFIISQSGIYAQWIDIYTNTDVSLIGIDCINEDTIYAAACNSYFLRSFDKGETWETINPGFKIIGQDIDFPNAKTGYIIGCTGKIAKTTDYGNNWNLITTDTLLRLDRVDFINPDTGYIIANGLAYGYWGVILQTLDGGESWNYQIIRDYELLDIKMINYSKGYIGITTWTFGDEYGFLKTVDAGESWNLSLPEADYITSISFINDETGYCLGMFGPEGGLFKTVDGGDSWSFSQGGVGGYTVNRLQFIDEQTGFYSGWEATFDDGLISRTDDGGNTWNGQKTGCFFDFEMINADTGYAVTVTDHSTIYKTTNGGIPVGVNEPMNLVVNDISIYPNPINQRAILFIKSDIITKKHENLNFSLYSLSGKLQKRFNDISSNETVILRDNLPSGIYLYTLSGDDSVIKSGKLIIK